MPSSLENWKTQIKKGYLELCILLLIQSQKRVYGFDIIEKLKALSLPIKEGTLYPLLNRMSADKILSSEWETENLKGHPRKFYSLTLLGEEVILKMQNEFESMNQIFKKLKQGEKQSGNNRAS